jgi:type IX secretion system PorP/SprF family membrane protein
MRKIFITLSLFSALTSMAQQDPLLSHNVFNQMAINPAYTGSSGMICATAIHRQQWMGFGEGSPITSLVNVDAAINPFGLSSGIGLNILQDEFGFNKDIGVDLAYAVRFSIQGVGNLAFGVNGGFINNTLEPSWNFPDAQGLDNNLVPQEPQSSMNFDLGAGVYFNSNEMFFGISATHLNQTTFYDEYPSYYRRHFYVTGGYFLQLPNQAWEVSPSVVISTDLVINHLTAGINFIYNKKFWGGVSYRVGESVTGMIGIELFSGMRVGYAYDFSTTEISSFNSGSHELMLGYCFSLKKERAPQQYKSIRFL